MMHCHEAESVADLSNWAGGEDAEKGRDNFGKKAVITQEDRMCGLERKIIYMALLMSR